MSPFSSPPDPFIFKTKVWEIVRQIPPGKVTTYGFIASLIPPPFGVQAKSYLTLGARWVGWAMKACPDEVPWQRVINAQGKISLNASADQQRKLLEAEGVVFDEHEKVNLKKFQWSGPSEVWCKAHALLPLSETKYIIMF